MYLPLPAFLDLEFFTLTPKQNCNFGTTRLKQGRTLGRARGADPLFRLKSSKYIRGLVIKGEMFEKKISVRGQKIPNTANSIRKPLKIPTSAVQPDSK